MNIFCVTVRFFVWQCVFFVHHCHVYDISYTRKIVSFYQTKQIMGATTSQGRLLLEIDHLFYLKVKKTKEAIFLWLGEFFFYRNGYSSQMTLRVPCQWWYWLHVVMVIVNVYDYPSQGDSPIGEGVSPGSNLGVNWFQDGLSLRSAAMSYTIHMYV